MTKEYELRDEKPEYYEMHVSETRDEMQKHIEEFYKLRGFTCPDYSETLGMVLAVSWIKAGGTDSNLIAVLFLNEQNLGMSIITHESVHLGLCFERYRNKIKRPAYGKSIGPSEERLAYIVGECASGIVNCLRGNGHYKE